MAEGFIPRSIRAFESFSIAMLSEVSPCSRIECAMRVTGKSSVGRERDFFFRPPATTFFRGGPYVLSKNASNSASSQLLMSDHRASKEARDSLSDSLDNSALVFAFITKCFRESHAYCIRGARKIINNLLVCGAVYRQHFLVDNEPVSAIGDAIVQKARLMNPT